MSVVICSLCIIALIVALVFAAMPHIFKIIRCGKPKPADYHCFSYKTVATGKPYQFEISDDYNIRLPDEHDLHFLQNYNTLAFLVLRDGKLVYEQYFGISPDFRVNSFSAAKTVVSLLTGIAIDRGFLSLEQQAGEFFPSLKDSGITLWHLLTMSSGIDWNENFNSLMSDVVRAFYTDDLRPLLKKIKPKYSPGVFSYQCGNTLLLGQIIERVSGQKLTDFASETLWKPLGAEYPSFWTTDRNGIVKSFCCFYATARDFAKIGQLLLGLGSYRGKQIVSRQYVRQMLSRQNLTNVHGQPVPYGLHIWTAKIDSYEFPYMRGMYGQYIIVLPAENLVIVRLGYKRVGETNYIPDDLPVYLRIGLGVGGV